MERTMNTMDRNYPRLTRQFGLVMALAGSVMISGCERSVEGLEAPSHPTTPEVFIDGFSSGLNYAAFGGSVLTAFQADQEVTYGGSAVAMRFEVPDYGDPRGAYAGGAFFTSTPRDLSNYDALTFWVRASQPASMDVIGMGIDLALSPNQISIQGLKLNTNWEKVIIPLPDASRLSEERGMFFYSEGPENGNGYTFWIDDVRFEKLGTLVHQKAGILDGDDRTIDTEQGEFIQLDGFFSSHNLPSGIDQRVSIAPSYFQFASSNPSVASVDQNGKIEILGSGSSVITAKLGNLDAIGSLTIQSAAIQRPRVAPPAPTQSAQNVISLYTNVYDNVLVDTWNTRWLYSTAEEEYIKVGEQDVIRYRFLNFAGIEFASQQIDASAMTHFRLDIWTPDPTASPKEFKVLLVDFGANGQYGGGDDSSHELTFKAPVLKTGEWVSLNIPLSQFTGLRSRKNLAQLVISGTLPTVYMTNVYFYK